jgi:hypothetical protein
MFTIKCYTEQGRCIIRSAESFTILRDDRTGEAEITLHNGVALASERVDIVPADRKREEGWPPTFQWAYIVNGAGNTVEIIRLKMLPKPRPTIAELEAILNSEEKLDVHVAPDGSVHASSTVSGD